MKLKDAKFIHIIGIGGIGTSSVAQIFQTQKKTITGSDLNNSKLIAALKRKGFKITIGHSAKNIPKNCQLVIYSPAIPPDNPELKEAAKRKIRTISYPEALGELSKDYFTIAICGTHGKSTTTAMTALILEKGGLDPTVVIGTKVREFKNQNFRVGKSKYLILEACEYKDSFLHLNPDILAITNIEPDHLDYFKNFKNYKESFKKLAKKSKKIIFNPKDKDSAEIVKNQQAELMPLNLDKNILKILSNKVEQLALSPGVPGQFNTYNSAVAALIGKSLKIESKKIEQAVGKFKGTWRRMEHKKTTLKPTQFIDDYAHHPTEITVTLKAIRETHPKAKILCIFQPHQYNRTLNLLKEFGKSFKDSDLVIIPNIYQVRDNKEDIAKVSTDNLVNEIKKNKTKALNGKGLKKTTEYILKNHKKFDLIVTMGAGDIAKIYDLIKLASK